MQDDSKYIVGAIREGTDKVLHDFEFGHYLGVAQIILLSLILWRVW